MPIPKPTEGESRETFMARCMGDTVMVNEYEPAQRYAVCSSTYEAQRNARTTEPNRSQARPTDSSPR